MNGVVIRHGYIVAEFGETDRVDTTYSVAKSYLSTILGLTIDRGMIKDVQDPVRQYVTDGGYDSKQNATITWEHHARQTSEWEGSLFGKSHEFLGAGSNTIWIDPEHDLVVVWRWYRGSPNDFYKRILRAVKSASQ